MSYTRYMHEYTKMMTAREFPDSDNHYVCYTDGSGWCNKYKNPHGVGAAAYVVLKRGNIMVEKSKSFINTTNNRMEQLAIISALNCCPKGSYVDVYSDSQYAISSLDNGNIYAKKNADMIRSYILNTRHLAGIRLHWVKGHNGNEWNEYVDNLASAAYAKLATQYGVPVLQR